MGASSRDAVRMSSSYTPSATRYEVRDDWFRRCGRSGLMLPAVSLGMWHNFAEPPEGRAEADWHDNARAMCFTAFDHGVTHFDLANNYGPPPGGAEIRVGRVLREMPREELVISTKAGYLMWPGPYGEWGSRKYLLSSLDASLKRLGLDYVDLFYHHRPDPAGGTPLEETLGALDQAVRSGKAIYAGISSYPAPLTVDAVRTCEARGFARPIIHQPSYSMLNRWIERDLLAEAGKAGLGVIAFSPLAQGVLTDRYLGGVPEDSRAASKSPFLKPERLDEALLSKVRRLNEVAQKRGQSLTRLALAWVLRDGRVTSALIGASKPEQIADAAKCLDAGPLTAGELEEIETILAE